MSEEAKEVPVQDRNEEVEKGAAAAAAAAAAASADSGAAAAAAKEKRSNYHYWHGNVDEKREKGDVAPLPVHTALERKEVEVDKTVVKQITSYSFCNNEKTVDCYIDFPNLDPEAVNVVFSPDYLTADIRDSKESPVVHRLFVKLSKAVIPDECKFKCKPSQLAVKLKKEDASATWFELEFKEGITL